MKEHTVYKRIRLDGLNTLSYIGITSDFISRRHEHIRIFPGCSVYVLFVFTPTNRKQRDYIEGVFIKSEIQQLDRHSVENISLEGNSSYKQPEQMIANRIKGTTTSNQGTSIPISVLLEGEHIRMRSYTAMAKYLNDQGHTIKPNQITEHFGRPKNKPAIKTKFDFYHDGDSRPDNAYQNALTNLFRF